MKELPSIRGMAHHRNTSKTIGKAQDGPHASLQQQQMCCSRLHAGPAVAATASAAGNYKRAKEFLSHAVSTVASMWRQPLWGGSCSFLPRRNSCWGSCCCLKRCNGRPLEYALPRIFTFQRQIRSDLRIQKRAQGSTPSS